MIAKVSVVSGVYVWDVNGRKLMFASQHGFVENIIRVEEWDNEDGYLELYALTKENGLIKDEIDLYDICEDLNEGSQMYKDVKDVYYEN